MNTNRFCNDFFQTSPDRSKSVCARRLFERRAASAPDAVALVDQNEIMTYRQLNISANQLAHHLRQCGVELESLVGLHFMRSIDLVVAMLGCFKAGAAFVPLDPEYPAHRLEQVVQDTNMNMLLSHSSLRHRLPEYRGRFACL